MFEKSGKMDGDFDYNVMMDLDDDFARDNGGYGGYGQGSFPYDPTFNPHGVGAYSEYDGSDYDYDQEQGVEDDDWQQSNPTNVTQARPSVSSVIQTEQVQVIINLNGERLNLAVKINQREQ